MCCDGILLAFVILLSETHLGEIEYSHEIVALKVDRTKHCHFWSPYTNCPYPITLFMQTDCIDQIYIFSKVAFNFDVFQRQNYFALRISESYIIQNQIASSQNTFSHHLKSFKSTETFLVSLRMQMLSKQILKQKRPFSSSKKVRTQTLCECKRARIREN